MNTLLGKHRKASVLIDAAAMVMLVITGIAAACDFHPDFRFHFDCPFCHLQLQNNSPDDQFECKQFDPAFSLLSGWRLDPLETVIAKDNIYFNHNLSHAPPQQ